MQANNHNPIELRLFSRVSAIADGKEAAQWGLAKLAHRERELGEITNWADLIGGHPRVRRAARTVREWVTTYVYARKHSRRWKWRLSAMPFSAWRALSRYEDKFGEGQLYEMAAIWLQEGASIEALQANLAEATKSETSANGYYPVWQFSDRTVQRLIQERPDTCLVVLEGNGWEGQQVKVKVKK